MFLDPNALSWISGAPTLPEYTLDNRKVLYVTSDSMTTTEDPDDNTRCSLFGTAPAEVVAI
jgi:hypothetical protein